MFNGLSEALPHLFSLQAIVLVLIGLTIGTAAAILPGVSASTMMVLLLPLTFTMDKYQAFMFLVSLMGSAGFAGSMTSILINVPGDGINAATCLDGYPLARQGKAGVAIGASATSSGLGMIFGMGVLILTLPIIGQVILAFGPPEFFALSILGISLIGAISTRSPIKGMIAGLLGMMMGFIGDNQIVGGTRYTFGQLELSDGLALGPALIGLFALPELYDLLRSNQTISQSGITVKGGVWEGIMEVLRRPALFFRSSMLGTVMGLMPGVGQSVASWVSYYMAVGMSKDPESFGRGNIDGVIAPEATIDAKEAASLLPVLVFGLPGGVTTVILLSAFQIHGVVPGQPLLRDEMPLVWTMILTMLVCSVSTSILGFMFAAPMVRITLVPVAILVPVIYVLGLTGSFADQGKLYGVLLAVAFGILGIVMAEFDYGRAPLLLGMVLAPLAEKNWVQAVQLNRGSYEFLLRPITLGLLLVTAIAIAYPIVRRWRASRREPSEVTGQAAAGQPDESVTEAAFEAPAVIAPAGAPVDHKHAGASLGELVFVVALLLVTIVFIRQAFGFSPAARQMPLMVEIPMLGLLLWHGYLLARVWLRHRAAHSGVAAPAAEADGMRSVWVVLGWLLLLPALMLVVGIVPAGLIYTVALGLFFARAELSRSRTIWAVSTAVVMSGLIYYVFELILGVRLYPGILG